jgi:hypothetical protein
MTNRDMRFPTVSGAYGRDYKSADAALKDWVDGKDFQHETAVVFGGGRYTSERDWGHEVKIRYNRGQDCVVVHRVNNTWRQKRRELRPRRL